jgi:hypothetical protein
MQDIEAMADKLELQLLELVRQQLRSSGVAQVAEITFEDQHLMVPDRRLAITAQILELKRGRVHAHVIAWLPNGEAPDGKDRLDACVMGLSSTVDQAMDQATKVWLRLVGAPVLSCLAARPLLDADHFDGREEWGVPGGHGFVGPFAVRGTNNEIDLDLLARCAALRFDAYPDDKCAHLVKVTLAGRDGRWERHLEIDGHAINHIDETWSGLPEPVTPVVCIRFAVYMKA